MYFLLGKWENLWYNIANINRVKERVTMNKLEELLNNATDVIETSKIAKLLRKEEEKKKKKNVVVIVLAIIGGIAVIAGIAYAVYRFLNKNCIDVCEDEFIDEFDDEFDEDFFDDDYAVDDEVFEDEV